ncbi:phosphohydrolase [Methanocella sp. CWC-04]|uniref:Phosphohydrolase n=1 Tax=Methanooceanicella nereidis TaxID=2052831 RepID=A0AAP2RFB2_9EURY|nr:HD domain-containing protein [Methanocella sp. CWC-04]MCD1296017.1 phosphohydrolase [Methanocella sp. CWC-04]
MRRTTSPDIAAVIKSLNIAYDDSLSMYAAKNSGAVRRRPDSEDIRPPYFRDGDRIMHSKAYTRYIDKTQVFYLVKNDHITHRVLHVQLVAKISRQIGRCLRLNEDLIEAIALGHDIGHVPYGHDGEKYLSSISKKYGIGGFHHNLQSVRALDRMENLNLTLQVLDGIVSHNGEAHDLMIHPEYDKTWEIFDRQVEERQRIYEGHSGIMPMTMEGCVVRVSDTISYVGRDIEDAITLGLISRDDIPEKCAGVLGNTNRDIVNSLVIDVIENSYGKDHIALSRETAAALRELKDFNMTRIYTNPRVKTQARKIEKMFGMLFDTFLDDLKTQNTGSKIFTHYLDNFNDGSRADYIDTTGDPIIVRDFIAGMTDEYFNDMFSEIFLPEKMKSFLS